MRRSILFVLALVVMMMLVGCGPNDTTEMDSQVSAETSNRVSLQDDYDDALSIQGQLAAGTLLLEETELAVDEVMAAELLPLWRAAQSLMNSDTAAALEIEAIYKQVQDTMTPNQISTIAEMELTEETLTTMIEEGQLLVGRGDFVGGRSEDTGEGFSPPGGGFPGGQGGRGFPGGGPGEGMGFPEGINPDVMETRQAQVAEGGMESFMERMLITAVIRTLETITGEVSTDRVARPFDIVFDVIAEAIERSPAEIRAMTTEGMTLAEIVESNGADLEVVRKVLIEALNELPNAQELDLEALASDWLGFDE